MGPGDTGIESFATGGMRYSSLEGSVVVTQWGGLAWLVGITTLALCAVVAWLLSAGAVSRVLGPAAVAVLAGTVADDVVGRAPSLPMQSIDLPMELLPAGWSQLGALLFLLVGLLLMFRAAVVEGQQPGAPEAAAASSPERAGSVHGAPPSVVGPVPGPPVDGAAPVQPVDPQPDPHRFEPPS